MISSALANDPDLQAQRTLRELSTTVETQMAAFDGAAIQLTSVIRRIPDLEQQQAMGQVITDLVKTLHQFHDVATRGSKSRAERYEWVRKVRSTLNESTGRKAFDFDPFLAAVQDSLLRSSDGGGATVELESTVAKSLGDEAAFPQCWEILAYLLPRDARKRIYEPARLELLEDYLLSRSLRRGRWSRWAVNGVFLTRTLLLAGECGRVLFASGAVKFWLWLMAGVVALMIRILQRPPE